MAQRANLETTVAPCDMSINSGQMCQSIRSSPIFWEPVPLSDLVEAVGGPSSVSRKGKARPLEPGRDKNSPPSDPQKGHRESVGAKGRYARLFLLKIRYKIETLHEFQ
jgi:hypothetical protein